MVDTQRAALELFMTDEFVADMSEESLRAFATEELKAWGTRNNAQLVVGAPVQFHNATMLLPLQDAIKLKDKGMQRWLAIGHFIRPPAAEGERK